MRRFIGLRLSSGFLVLPLACVLALSGCATPNALDAATASDSAQAAVPGAVSVADLRSLTAGLSFDYEIVESTDALARLSDVVFTGIVLGVQDGPQFGRADDELPDVRSVVLETRATEVVQGDVVAGDSVYLILHAPAGVDAAQWNEALPGGSRIAVFATLSGERAAGGSGFDAIDAAAGRPAGEPLYVPAVQGLAVEVGDDELPAGGLYWPLTDVIREGRVDAALPGGPAVGNPLPGEDRAG